MSDKKILHINPKDNALRLTQTKSKWNGCSHNSILVDEELATVECEKCGKHLNPIAVLVRYAKEETRLNWRRMEVNEILQKIEKKKRTKCRHCGKMTEVNIPE